MSYQIILADPAWRYASNSEAKPGRNAMRHYPCMSLGDICALPVQEWVASDALLIMWTTSPFLELSMRVPRAWGFTYKSSLVWVKDRIGTGHWARNRHEIALICRRGKFPCDRPALFSDSVITGNQREHSRKPANIHEVIDARFPNMKKLEMFARERRRGWDAWGNETDKFEGAA